MSSPPAYGSEFGDHTGAAPYAPGDVLGLRVWKVQIRAEGYTVTPDGQTVHTPEQYALKSVYRDYFWRPGENVAACLPAPAGRSGVIPRIHTEDCIENHEHGTENPVRQDTCYRDHLRDSVDPGHSCGFYAYTVTESNKYLVAGAVQIEGMVQGYGLCTIGPKGFKAAKARILAFIRPSSEWTPPSSPLGRATWDRFDPDHLAYLFGVPLFETRQRLLEEYPLGLRPASWAL